MKNFKVVALNKEKTLTLIKFLTILGFSISAPFFKIQMVTGPLVNALLFIATIILGPYSAMLIGILPSAFSIAAGLLPSVLAPMIPFIMVSNAILILTFNYFQEKNFWLGVGAASIFKYVFLFITSQTLINLFLKDVPLVKAAALMMGWPQLVTAVIGGFIAYLFLKFIKKI